jgi:hypothetical protein
MEETERVRLGLMIDMEMVFRLLPRKVFPGYTTPRTRLWGTVLD